jgi:hypothetical protein
MPFVNDPSRRSWNQIAEDLRDLQAIVDLYKKRFEATDQKEIGDELEECIHLLIGAQMVAQTLDLAERGGR